MDGQGTVEQPPMVTGQAVPVNQAVALGQPISNGIEPPGLAAGEPHHSQPHVSLPAPGTGPPGLEPAGVIDQQLPQPQQPQPQQHELPCHTNMIIAQPVASEIAPTAPVMMLPTQPGLPMLPTQAGIHALAPPHLAPILEHVVLANKTAKSVVWKYFGFPPKAGTYDEPDKAFTRCRLCKGKIPYKGQTTNMLKHLESKHRAEYDEVRSKIGQSHVNFVGTTRVESRKRARTLDSDASDALVKSDAFARMSLPVVMTDLSNPEPPNPLVGIIMGSDSDLPTMHPACEILEQFGIPCEVTVVSAHRTPERMVEYAKSAHRRGIRVIIAGAGGAAHLPGMVASMTPLPVIGVPAVPSGSHMDGLDALMSIVQMPRGVPVACVAIGNATNAGLLAVRMLGISTPALMEAMLQYQEGMKQTVLEKAQRLETKGWRSYK